MERDDPNLRHEQPAEVRAEGGGDIMSTVREEITALSNEVRGPLTAEFVYGWAKANPESAIHKSLPWDDAKLGEEARINLCRRYIILYIKVHDAPPKRVTLFRVRHEPGYQDREVVLRSATLKRSLEEDCLRHLVRVMNDFSDLSRFEPVWKAIRKLREEDEGAKQAKRSLAETSRAQQS